MRGICTEVELAIVLITVAAEQAVIETVKVFDVVAVPPDGVAVTEIVSDIMVVVLPITRFDPDIESLAEAADKAYIKGQADTREPAVSKVERS